MIIVASWQITLRVRRKTSQADEAWGRSSPTEHSRGLPGGEYQHPQQAHENSYGSSFWHVWPVATHNMLETYHYMYLCHLLSFPARLWSQPCALGILCCRVVLGQTNVNILLFLIVCYCYSVFRKRAGYGGL